MTIIAVIFKHWGCTRQWTRIFTLLNLTSQELKRRFYYHLSFRVRKLRLRETEATHWRSLYSQDGAKSRNERDCQKSEFRRLTGWSGATLPDQYYIVCFCTFKAEMNDTEAVLMSVTLFSELQQGMDFGSPALNGFHSGFLHTLLSQLKTADGSLAFSFTYLYL